MNNIASKVESILAWIKPGSKEDENIIDLQKTFSAAGIDILPVVIKILELEAGFPTSRIQTKEGIKYHELEFFQSNISGSASQHTHHMQDTQHQQHTHHQQHVQDTHHQQHVQDTPPPHQSKSDDTIFTRLDKTSTKLGSTLLKSMILNPYHTVEEIRNIVINRQNTILQLAETNPNLIKQITNLIANLGKIEQDLLAMSLEDTPEMEEVYKIIFFEIGPLRYLNYHSLFLKIFYYFMIIFSPLYGIIAPFVFLFAPFLFMKYILKIPIPLDTFCNIMKKMLFGGTGFMTMLDKLFNSQMGAGIQTSLFGDGISVKSVVFWLVRMAILILNSNLGGYAYIGFIVISYLYGIYNSLQVSITFNKIINMFHARMNILAKWIRGCVQLYRLGVCAGSVELVPILGQIRMSLGDELVQMLLESSVFDNEPGLISDKGIIIKCFRLFLDAKKQGRDIIAPFARYMAYIDVFSALSSWLREKDDRCPATFILDGINPTIQGSSIWNLACATPIYNDVLLGGNSNAETYTNNIEADKVDKIDNVDKVDKVDTLDDKKKVEEDKQDEKEDDIVDCTEDNSSRDDSTSVSIKEEFQENSSSESSNASSNASSNTSANKPINNVIITGPNGSGKSTYIKSITECVILAQTLGLVPAREFKLTPFAHISTYLNIPDCQGKESLFQAEMNRCYQQLETLKSAEEAGEFTFNIMDEIFVSTNYQEGMSGAYAVINQLCRFNKCLNIITTHFDKLANLEDLRVVRKYFDIELGEDGQVARDFKIRDGVSKKHMALKLLRNRGFNEELVKDAENFYEKNCK